MAGTFTYDVTKFADTDPGKYTGSTVGVRYQIRLLLQDTNSARPLFLDEEIDFAQTQEANTYMAVAALAKALVAKAGSVKSKKVDDLSITYDPKFYITLVGQMEARGAGHQIPYAGGISVADKEARQQDTDWVQPSIVRNLDNNPAAPAPETPPSNPLTTI